MADDDETEARRDWRIGVLMADGRTAYQVVHDETERRALHEAVMSAAFYRGRKGRNPPIRIASVQTLETMSERGAGT